MNSNICSGTHSGKTPSFERDPELVNAIRNAINANVTPFSIVKQFLSIFIVKELMKLAILHKPLLNTYQVKPHNEFVERP